MGILIRAYALLCALGSCHSALAADAVNLNGEVPTSQSQGMLTLKSAQGVELRLSFIKVASASVGAEAGTSVAQVRIEVMNSPTPVRDGIIGLSTTCTRISPTRGTPFQNQQSPNFRLTFGPHQLPEAFVPLTAIVLMKDVHGGEFHTCEANLGFTINGVPQVDPITRSTTFHPMF